MHLSQCHTFCSSPYTQDVCPPNGHGGCGCNGGLGGHGGLHGHGRHGGHGLYGGHGRLTFFFTGNYSGCKAPNLFGASDQTPPEELDFFGMLP